MTEPNPTDPTPPEDNVIGIRHGFVVGDLHLLIPQGVACELLEDWVVSPIPFAPSWFKGMANHRGDVVPVFSLPELLLQDPSAANKRSWLIVLDKPPAMSALLINRYPQLLNDVQEVQETGLDLAPELIRPYLTRAYESDGKIWLDFRHDAWLSSLKQLFQDYQAHR